MNIDKSLNHIDTDKQRIIYACFSSYNDVPTLVELKQFNQVQLDELSKKLNRYLVDKYL